MKHTVTFSILTDYLDTEFNNKALTGITEFSREKGINLIFFVGGNLQSPYSWERNRSILLGLPDRNMSDGIIVLSPLIGQYVGPENFREFCSGFQGLPVVTVSEWMEGKPAVLIDNETAMNALLSHLIKDHGLRKFAIIRGPKGIPDAEERFDTCITAFRKYNIPIDPDHIIETPFGVTSGIWAVEQLLDQRKADFEAIIAPNDHTALGAMKALQMRGIPVPEKVVVVGFDDINESRHSSPALTTISQPITELGKAAAQMLHDIINGTQPACLIKTFTTQLVIRESCGCHLHDGETHLGRVLSPAPVREPFEVLYERNLDSIRTEMINALIDLNPDKKAPFFGALDLVLNSFSLAVRNRKPETFMQVWKDVASRLMNSGYTAFILASLLATLRKHAIACIQDFELLLLAEDIFFQAVSKTGLQTSETQITQYVLQQSMGMRMNIFFSTLDSARNLEQQINIMSMGIPSLNLKSFFLVLYNPQEGGETGAEILSARLYLGLIDNQCVLLEKNGLEYPLKDMIHDGIQSRIGEYMFVVEALFLGPDQIGFICVGVTDFSNNFTEQIRLQLSTALRNTILLDRIRSLTNNLQALAETKNEDLAKVNASLRKELKKMQDILTGSGESLPADSGEDMRIQKALHYIDENYNNDISLDEIAGKVFMNPIYFSNFFKARVGTGFLEYLTSHRVEKALKLLGNPQLTIKEIAAMVGYRDPNYFGKIFKKHTSLLPTEYRQKILKSRGPDSGLVGTRGCQ